MSYRPLYASTRHRDRDYGVRHHRHDDVRLPRQQQVIGCDEPGRKMPSQLRQTLERATQLPKAKATMS